DAQNAYPEMLSAIATAKHYILFQFYIFRDDDAGNAFRKALAAKAKQGVRIYFITDQIGTNFGQKYIRDLELSGIQSTSFRGTKTLFSRLQINFRNHRKVVVVDGLTAFIGGLNIGDDYLGKWLSIGPWRDTHIKLVGPSALSAQVSFAKDWFW